MRKILVLSLVFAQLGLAAPALAADGKSLAAAIDKTAAAAIAAGESPAIQLAVFKDGKPLLVKAYGSANLELKVPANNNSVFRIGSVTKQFTAVTLLLLQEEGKLSLDDKLARYYPDFPRAGDITLAQMLHHTSGIYNYTSNKDFFPKDGFQHRTTDEMVRYIAGLPKTQDFEPGTSWYYSNSAYFILGGVIEKATGQTLAEVLQARLFKPLGMTQTAFDDEAEIVAGRVAGYGSTGRGKFTNATFLSMTAPGAGGSLRSSASDLMKWNAALHGGKLLKPASLQAMLAPGRLKDGASTGPTMVELFKQYGQADEGDQEEYGYGIVVANKQGHKKIHHGGGINGFNAYLAEFPDDRLAIAVLTNTIGKDVGVVNVAERIERLALGLPPKK